jgi:hypothetical protein
MKQPIAGIAGTKPRANAGNGQLSRAEAHELNREYLIQRNIALQLKNGREQVALAKARGELIEKKVAILQAVNLFTSLRQRALAEPAKLARRLVQGGFIEEARQFEAERVILAALCALLEELSGLPQRMAGRGGAAEKVKRPHRKPGVKIKS